MSSMSIWHDWHSDTEYLETTYEWSQSIIRGESLDLRIGQSRGMDIISIDSVLTSNGALEYLGI